MNTQGLCVYLTTLILQCSYRKKLWCMCMTILCTSLFNSVWWMFVEHYGGRSVCYNKLMGRRVKLMYAKLTLKIRPSGNTVSHLESILHWECIGLVWWHCCIVLCATFSNLFCCLCWLWIFIAITSPPSSVCNVAMHVTFLSFHIAMYGTSLHSFKLYHFILSVIYK